MATQTKYTYSVSGDTAASAVALDKLQSEIVAAAGIIIAPDYVAVAGDVLDVYMKDALPAGEKTALDAVIAAHDGVPLAGNPQAVRLYTSTGAAPETSDGKPIFLPNLFRGDVEINFPGVGDNGTSGRGQGNNFQLSRNTAGDVSQTWQFADWVYITGGIIIYKGAQLGDHCSFEVRAPASSVTPNAGLGNCNLVPIGGGVNLIVPAAGDGSHDVNLATAVPVPSSDGTGYYDWDCPDEGLGTVSASGTPGAADYNLLDQEVGLVKWVTKVHILGDGSMDDKLVAVKPKKILPQWESKVTLHNEGGGHEVQLVWNLFTARKKTY